MTTQILRTGADPLSTQTTPLDGTPYRLRFAYNLRAASWYLDLATLDGEAIASGLKLVCNWSLLLKCASALRPPGILIVISATTDASNPGLLDLLPAGRCSLVYVPIADLAP